MKIAIFGKLRAGKSAVCQVLTDKLEKNGGAEVIEFSGAVKEVVNILHPELCGVKHRKVYVDTAQHLRKLDEDIWVNIVKHKINNSKKKHIIVSGVRQENEYEMLKKEGFIFVKVDCDETTRVERCKKCGDKFDKKQLLNHTEMIMDSFKFDYSILNNKSFKELEISANNLIGDIFSKEYSESIRSNLFSLNGGDTIG